MCDSVTNSPRRRTRAAQRAKQNETTLANIKKTPGKRQTIATSSVVTPSKSGISENAQTPRRSARKSVKPTLDYNEIVNPSSASKKKIIDENHWNAAEVGRTSEKRGRKRRNIAKMADANESDETSDVEDEEDSNEAERKLNTEIKRVNLQENEIENITTSIFSADDTETIAIKKINDSKLELLDLGLAPLEEEQDTEGTSDCNKKEEKAIGEKSYDLKMLNLEEEQDIVGKIDANKQEMANKQESDELVMLPLEEEQDIEGVIDKIDANKQKDNANKQKSDELGLLDLGLVPLEEQQDIEGKIDAKEQDIEDKIDANKQENANKQESDELGLLDLGLAPLEEEQDIKGANDAKEQEIEGKIDANKQENANKQKSDEQDTKDEKTSGETPDEIIEVEEMDEADVSNNLNATFDTSDCIIISPESEKRAIVIPNIIITSPTAKDKSQNERARSSKTPRLPTPYKPRNRAELEAVENLDTSLFEESKSTIVDIPLNQIVSKSIRKRSLSLSVDISGLSAAKRARNRVTFYSPANVTKIIDDFEEEEDEPMKENVKIVEEPSFITKRRRRSKSFDETFTRKPVTPKKTQASRTIVPNFAAIHQKRFEKMENIVDHVARKAERAKVLTSATKTVSVSAKKTQTPGRYGRVSTFEKEKPKVSRKIELPHIGDAMIEETAAKTVQKSRIPLIIPTAKTFTPPQRFKKAASAEPQAYKNMHRLKSKTISKKPLTKKRLSKSAIDLTVAALKSMETNPFTFNKLPSANDGDAANKVAERRARNLKMFKNRSEEDNEQKMKNKRDEIRGVRLNRRYLLQMEHRRNMNK